MTFWQEACYQFRQIWTNPWWYIALLFFVFGPFLHKDGLNLQDYPWWAWIYMPVMIPTIFFLALLDKRFRKK